MANFTETDIAKLRRERDAILEAADANFTDVLSSEYAEMRKLVVSYDRQIQEWEKQNTEQRKLDVEERKIENAKIELENTDALEKQKLEVERRKLDIEQTKINTNYAIENARIASDHDRMLTDKKVAGYTLWGVLGSAFISTFGSLAGNYMKYRMGSEVIQDTTRQAFELDQEKVQSRVAADKAKEGFGFFFR